MTSLSLMASPYDRLDPAAAAIRWWLGQMASFARHSRPRRVDMQELDSLRRVPKSVVILVGEADAFCANFVLPKGSPEQHRRALHLRLAQLCPINPDKLELVASAVQRTPESVTYAITMARGDRLVQLERAARKKGARKVTFQATGRADLNLLSPTTRKTHRRATLLNASLAGLLIIGASLAVQVWATRLNQEAAAISVAERKLRRTVMADQTARREADLAAQLIEEGFLQRRAGAAFEALAQLSAATPNTAWWMSYRWTPDAIVVSGQSPDATGAIKYLAEKSPSWRIEMGGPLNAAGALQTFEVRLKPKYERDRR